jgi:hypothetical protein
MEKDVMLSKLALSQLLCLVAVKETTHEEDRWEQISDQHELQDLHHLLLLDLMPNEESSHLVRIPHHRTVFLHNCDGRLIITVNHENTFIGCLP